MLQRDGQPVRRRAGQPGGCDELREGRGPRFERTEDGGRLVEDSDAARIVHEMILPSQRMRRKFAGERPDVMLTTLSLIHI